MSVKFEYQIPLWRSFLGVAFCFAFAIGMGYFAHVNEKGLRLFRLFTLTSGEASTLYWGFAGTLALATILFFILIARSMKGPVAISLEETFLVAPSAAIRSELLSIPYSSIKQVLAQQFGKQAMVTINSAVGQVRLMEMGFRSPQEYAKFKQALADRVNG
ncbi:MAG: hypothetical protein KKC46_22100 [Proteobacteria bacterium]|nr:hypothetical protein [Pseudomonadota bacterium]